VSAEIIDFHAWRRAHRAPETALGRIPFLVPTWPWGWLQPALVEVDLGMMTGRSKSPCGERRVTATADRLSLAPPSKGGQKR